MPVVAMGSLVFLRYPRPSDAREFLFLMRVSRQMHRPWVYPPATEEAFARYVEQAQSARFLGCLICHRRSGEIFGVANLSEIVRGGFQNAYLGFYGSIARSGNGRIREGVALLVHHAFRHLKLHRVEANVQPANERSLALVRSLGFRHEGLSPRYLKIGGKWRDHERFAILAEEWPGMAEVMKPRA